MRSIKRLIRSQKGFSLTEVVIAMAIFGVVGASIMSGLNASSKTIASSQEITIAESLTRTIIEYIKRSPYDFEVVTTNLNGNIDDDDETIPVDDTDDFPANGIIQIEDELIRYAGMSGNSFTGCERGFAGTTAASHDNNFPVADTPVYTANDAGIDLSGDPYYSDYVVDTGVLRLDADADDTEDYKDDDGIQKILVVIKYQGKSTLTTEAYKVNR